MGHAPPACQNNALPVPVKSPKRPFDRSPNGCRETVILDKRSRGRVYEPSQLVNGDGAEDITRHIKQGFAGMFLMQMFGNNRVNFR
jgi:hypothetical protein